jgi:arylsulfatase A-like enzyme
LARRFTLLSPLALAALACVAIGCGPRVGPTVRHVIVISLDTAREDHFGCYGNRWIDTPNIDALAEESVLLGNFVTVVPTTLASHTSLFTGKYPHTHGIPRNGFTVHPDNVLLPEILKGEGFTTLGFLGSFALDSRFGFDQGFDHFDETFDVMVDQEDVDQNQRSAAAVTDAVITYLESGGVPRNMFLFAHYFDPHAPYDPPPPFDEMYGQEGIGGVTAPPVPRRYEASKAEWIDHALGFRRDYAGEISYMDREVGRLLDYLKRREVLDDAVLVLVSDHGENLGEHGGRFDHGWATYETTMRAVALIRLPQARHRGVRVSRLLANIDILPTLLDFLGLPVPEGVDGVAIDLNDPAAPAPSSPRFGEASKPWEEIETDPQWFNMRKSRCIWDGDLKFVQVPYLGVEALFNLAEDPQESTNLVLHRPGESADQITRLRGLLEEWAASADPLPSRFAGDRDEETIERLRALGYLGP